jgi:hypothetical protein
MLWFVFGAGSSAVRYSHWDSLWPAACRNHLNTVLCVAMVGRLKEE